VAVTIIVMTIILVVINNNNHDDNHNLNKIMLNANDNNNCYSISGSINNNSPNDQNGPNYNTNRNSMIIVAGVIVTCLIPVLIIINIMVECQ